MTNNVIIGPQGIGNHFLVKGTDGYLLIDTGLRNNYAKLVKLLNNHQIKLTDIKMIVITHADGDHFGCLDLLQSASPAIVCAASEIEAESIRKGVSSRPMKVKGLAKLFFSLTGALFASKPAQIQRILKPGDVLPYLGGLQILDTKGHTPGHLSLWSEKEKILFGGDSVRVINGVFSPSTGANTWDEDLANKSFTAQMALNPGHIYGGHWIWHNNN
jgi:glyoxylase-like metal-dependent hydrolase (beta-lactamase superfamily II)